MKLHSLAALCTAWLLTVGLAIVSAPLASQCTNTWLPGDGVAGCDGTVNASLVWDPDGAGPMPPLWIVGGAFTVIGNVVAKNLAVYDPVSGNWSELGGGLQSGVTSLTTLPSGELLIGGLFAYIFGGTPSRCLARWDGASMHSMGYTGFVRVDCVCVQPNGDIVAGGDPENGNSPVVRRWNGTSWSTIGEMWGASVGIAAVSSLLSMPNGDVVAAGSFTSVVWVPANCIARWDGSVWSAFAAGVSGSTFSVNPRINALTLQLNGDIIAGGNFLTAGGVAAHGIARWDGSSWSNVGSNWTATVGALLSLPNGDLIAGGFTGSQAPNVARWDGATWTVLGSGMRELPVWQNWAPMIRTLASLPNGDLVAGGTFREAGGVAARNLASWNGSNWSGMATGTNAAMHAVAELPNGDLVVGGDFTAVGGVAVRSVARWDGMTWLPLGLGMSNDPSATLPATVRAVALLPNGDLVAGGDFTYADGTTVNHIARWDGFAWSALGSGMNAPVMALIVLPNGDLVAGGEFTNAGGTFVSSIARWDGTSWSALGGGLSRSASLYVIAGVYALAVLANGDILAGGNFTRAGPGVADFAARWDGSTWHPMCASMTGPMGLLDRPGVYSFCPLPNGDVLVGGWFTQIDGNSRNRIARWNSHWTALGTGILGSASGHSAIVHTIEVLPDGDLLAGGYFLGAGTGTATHIARFHGSAWSPVDSNLNGAVFDLVTSKDGGVVACGAFTRPGNLYYPTTTTVAAGLARLTTTCPANIDTYGVGCNGVGGPNVLIATTRPWIGSTYLARATGMPLLGLAIDVHGFASMSTLLAAILPQGAPGCNLLVQPDSLHLAVPTAGVVETAIALPNAVAIIGLVFQQQVVAIELDSAGVMTALTSSNALQLTVGAF